MTTTRFPNGVTNVGESSPFASMGQLAPTRYHTFWEDFDNYFASEWNEQKSAGASVYASPADGGILTLSSSGGNQFAFTGLTNQTFTPGSGVNSVVSKPLYFETRVAVSSPSNGSIQIGLTESGFSGGLWFQKDDGSSQFNFYLRPSGNSPIITPIPSAVANLGEWMTLAFVVDAGPVVSLYVNGSLVGVAGGAASLVASALIGPEILFQTQTGSFSNSLSIDYLFAAKER